MFMPDLWSILVVVPLSVCGANSRANPARYASMGTSEPQKVTRERLLFLKTGCALGDYPVSTSKLVEIALGVNEKFRFQ